MPILALLGFLLLLTKAQSDAEVPAPPESVEQISTLANLVADLAVDDDMESYSHTDCAHDTDVWYKMKFARGYYFKSVVIAQAHNISLYNAQRMNGTKIFVVDNEKSTEALCGTLKIKNDLTVRGQTYYINCGVLAYGDEIKLVVNHNTKDPPGCIHMKDIKANVAPSCEAGQKLDTRTGCQDCPADHWSDADNKLDTCEPCPAGKGVGAGMGKQEGDCTEKKSENGYQNVSKAAFSKINVLLLLAYPLIVFLV